MDSGNMHHFVGADSSCISWGHAQSGELGDGPKGQKYVMVSIYTHFCLHTDTHTYVYTHILKTLFYLMLFFIYPLFRSSANPKKVEILEGMHVFRSVLLHLIILW